MHLQSILISSFIGISDHRPPNRTARSFVAVLLCTFHATLTDCLCLLQCISILCYPLLLYALICPVITICSNFLFLIKWPINLACCVPMLLMISLFDLVVLRMTSFSFQSMTLSAFFSRTTFKWFLCIFLTLVSAQFYMKKLHQIALKTTKVNTNTLIHIVINAQPRDDLFTNFTNITTYPVTTSSVIP